MNPIARVLRERGRAWPDRRANKGYDQKRRNLGVAENVMPRGKEHCGKD